MAPIILTIVLDRGELEEVDGGGVGRVGAVFFGFAAVAVAVAIGGGDDEAFAVGVEGDGLAIGERGGGVEGFFFAEAEEEEFAVAGIAAGDGHAEAAGVDDEVFDEAV